MLLMVLNPARRFVYHHLNGTLVRSVVRCVEPVITRPESFMKEPSGVGTDQQQGENGNEEVEEEEEEEEKVVEEKEVEEEEE